MKSLRPIARGLAPLIALTACLTLVSCASGGASPTSRQPSAPRPTATPPDMNSVASSLMRDRLDSLLAGTIVVENRGAIDWTPVERHTLPAGLQRDAFCEALDTPHLDDVVTKLIAVGLDAVARRGGRELPADAETVVGLVVTLAFKTCPSWKPALHPPTAVPTVPSHVGSFSALAGDPSTEWRLVPSTEANCQSYFSSCWEAQLRTARGCPTHASMTISILDAHGTPLRLATASRVLPVRQGGMADFVFQADDPTELARVFLATCT